MGHHAGIFGGAIDHFVAAAPAAAAHIIGIAVAVAAVTVAVHDAVMVVVKGHPPGIFLANAIVLAQILGRPVRVVQHPANLAQNVAGKVPLSQIEVPLLHLPFCVCVSAVVVVSAAVVAAVVELPLLMLLLLFWRRRLGLRQWRRRRGGKR